MSIIALSALLMGIHAHAQSSLPQNITVEGRFYDGSSPMNEPVNVKLEVLVQDSSFPSCVLYTESHLGVQVGAASPASQGYFALSLGSGTSVVSPLPFARVFSNSENITGLGGDCANIPNLANKPRVVRISVNKVSDGSGTYVTLSPDTVLTSVPTALVAETLTGKSASDFVQVRDDVTYDLNQANLENVFSSTNYARLTQLLAPSAPVTMAGQRISNVANPTAAQDAATKNYTDANLGGKTIDLSDVAPGTGGGKVLTWDQVANKWVATSPALSGAAGGDLSGNFPNPQIAALAVGTSKIQNDAIKSAKINSTGIATNRVLITDATDGSSVTYASCANNEVLKFVTGTGWQCATVASLSAVTSVAGKSGAVTLNAADIGGLGTASVRDIGAAAANIPELDGTAKLAVSTIPSLSGDLTGAYPNALVAKLHGREVADTAPLASQVLQWNGSRWQPATMTDNVGITALNGDITASGPGLASATLNNNVVTTPKMFANPGANRLIATDATTGATLAPFVCNLDEIMQWTAGGWVCRTIATALGSQFIVDGGNTRGASVSIGTNDASSLTLETANTPRLYISPTGSVGIGTTSATNLLDMVGSSNGMLASTVQNTDPTGTSWIRVTNDLGNSMQMGVAGSAFGTAGIYAPNTATVYSDTNLAGLNVGTEGAQPLKLFTANTQRMIVDAAGNVGIGTTAARLLHVAGAVRINPSTLPSTPFAGDLAFDTADGNALKFHDGASWRKVGTGTGTGDFKADGSVSMTGSIDAEGGTAAAPAIYFNGDLNSGLFSDTPDNLALSTQGMERLRIDAGGNLLIGSGTTLAQVTVSHLSNSTSATESSLNVSRNASPIGASTAVQRGIYGYVSWNGNSNSSSAKVEGVAGRANVTSIFNVGTMNGVAGYATNNVSGSTTDKSNGIYGLASASAGSTVTEATGGRFSVTNSGGTVTNAYGIYIDTLQGTNKWAVFSPDVNAPSYFNGYVGLGISTPQRLLHVNGPMRIAPAGLPTSPTAGDLAFDSASSNALKYHNGSNWVNVGSGTGDFLADGSVSMTGNLRLNNRWLSGDGGNEGVYVDSAGQVGIGTSSPSQKLSVNGDVNALVFRPTGGGYGLYHTSGGITYSTYLGGGHVQIGAESAHKVGITTDDIDRITILPGNGNVGIGNTNPSRLLHVSGVMKLNPTANPGTPTAGDIFVDSGAANSLKYHNGSAWVAVGNGDFYASGSVPMSGQLRLKGSTGPTDAALTFQNDTASGIFSSAAGTVGIATSGVERININATGNVHIGAGSATRRLQVAGAMKLNPTANPGTPTAGDIFVDSGDANKFKWHNGTNWKSAGDFMADGSVSMTNALKVADGLPGAPGLTFASDMDNGLFLPAANTMAMSTGGSERLRIGNTGLVGIGTSNPLTQLHISTSSPVSSLRLTTQSAGVTSSDGFGMLYDSSSTGEGKIWMYEPSPIVFGVSSGEAMRISTDGKVGIGTSGGTRLLEVGGGIRLYPISTPVGAQAGEIFIDAAQSNSLRYHNGTTWLTMGTGNGDFLANGSLPMSGNLRLNNNWLSGDGGNEGVYVNSTGQVGIGTTNPAQTLDVNGNIKASMGNFAGVFTSYGNISAYVPQSTASPTISGATGISVANTNPIDVSMAPVRFNVINATSNGQQAYISAVATPGATNSPTLVFGQQTGPTAYSERMRLDSDGNVGIGTTSPNAKLDVYGQIRSASPAGTSISNSGYSVNWNGGNAQELNSDCSSNIDLQNVLDGGSYTLAQIHPSTNQCNFTAAGLTFYYYPGNGARNPGSRTIYSFQRIGAAVYVSWVTGFQ